MSDVWKLLGRWQKSNPEISFSLGKTSQATPLGKGPSKSNKDLRVPLSYKKAEFVGTAMGSGKVPRG